MIKISGKPSSDPVQEKLRQNKKVWNKKVSEFADDLFRFKDMLNGKPSKFFQEKSSIKDPIPADPATIIGSLLNDFQDIVQGSNALIAQQIDYSKNRRKKQIKSVVPGPVTASYNNYSLYSNSSSVFSRFFTRILNPTFRSSPESRIKKYRLSMLKAMVEINDLLLELQTQVVKSGADSIFASNKLLSKLDNNWRFFVSGLESYSNNELVNKPSATNDSKKQLPEKKEKNEPEPEAKKTVVEKTIPESPPFKMYQPSEQSPAVPVNMRDSSVSNIEKANEVVSDYKKNVANFTGYDGGDLLKYIASYLIRQTEDRAIKLVEEYLKQIEYLNNLYNTNGSSFGEIFKLKKTTALRSVDMLEVVGQNIVNRWLGKLKHQISPFDKTSAQRLDIYKSIDVLLKITNQIMDSLESEMNIDVLNSLSKEFDGEMIKVHNSLYALSALLTGKGFERPFMSLLESGKITELEPDLSDKQKEYLRKMIETKRLRQLTDFYSRK